MKWWLILCLMVLPSAFVIQAQTEDEGVDFTAFYIQPSISGSFAPNGDSFTLTLEGIPSITPMIAITPVRDAREELTGLLTEALSIVIPSLQPIATLRVEGKTHIFLIQAISYDPSRGSVTYTLSYLSPAKPDISETFAEAVLFIYVENRLGALLDSTLIELKNSARSGVFTTENNDRCFVAGDADIKLMWCNSFGKLDPALKDLKEYEGTQLQVSTYMYQTYGVGSLASGGG